jgi:transcriptional regulator of heat shock response
MLTERQKKILDAVVKEYVRTAEPISSSQICQKNNLDCSSATIRSEFNFLTKAGYLEQLFTSSGRVPTDKAYRFIVDQIMGDTALPLSDQKKIQSEYLKLKAEYKRLAKLTSKLLSRFAKGIAVVGDVGDAEAYETGMSGLLKEPEYESVKSVTEAVDLIEYFDSHLKDIYNKISSQEPKVFIGHENVFKSVNNHSVIISGYKLKSGEKGIVALIGPKRMNYKKNLALIKGVIESVSRNLLPLVIICPTIIILLQINPKNF